MHFSRLSLLLFPNIRSICEQKVNICTFSNLTFLFSFATSSSTAQQLQRRDRNVPPPLSLRFLFVYKYTIARYNKDSMHSFARCGRPCLKCSPAILLQYSNDLDIVTFDSSISDNRKQSSKRAIASSFSAFISPNDAEASYNVTAFFKLPTASAWYATIATKNMASGPLPYVSS